MTTTHCNTLQHTATHYSTLQHTAIHCNCALTSKQLPKSELLKRGSEADYVTATHRNTRQHTATRCNRALTNHVPESKLVRQTK